MMPGSPRICLERCDEDIDLLSELLENNTDTTSEDRFDMSDEILGNEIDDLTSYLCRSSKQEYFDRPKSSLSQADSCTSPLGGEDSPTSSVPSHTPLHTPEVVNKSVDQQVSVPRVVTNILYVPKSQPSMNKNAIIARENRIKKKKYVQQMESEVVGLRKENTELKTRILSQDSKIEKLNQQLQYFKNVIANQSTLSALLQNIQNTSGVKFKTSWSVKRRLEDGVERGNASSRKNKDENCENMSQQKAKRKCAFESESLNQDKRIRIENTEQNSESEVGGSGEVVGEIVLPDQSAQKGGVCLHVSGRDVSLEFCVACSKMATSSSPVLDDHSYVRTRFNC